MNTWEDGDITSESGRTIWTKQMLPRLPPGHYTGPALRADKWLLLPPRFCLSDIHHRHFLMILTIFSQVKLKEIFLIKFQNVLSQESSTKGKVLGECRHGSCEKCIRVVISNALKGHTCSVYSHPHWFWWGRKEAALTEQDKRLALLPLPLLRTRWTPGSESLPSPARLSCILTFYFTSGNPDV